MITREEKEKIDKYLKLTGVKKSKVAADIGCSPTEFSQFYNGKRSLKIESKTKLLIKINLRNG